MKKSIFEVPKMDCPSEENMIRLALRAVAGIENSKFDLVERKVTIIHGNDASLILNAIEPLGFGARLSTTEELSKEQFEDINATVQTLEENPAEARVLKQLLAINFTMFVAEIIIGWLAQSTGVIADAMDMFADSAVYGVSLYAVGRALSTQYKAARLSGYLQGALALFALFEVVRRFIFGSEPWAQYMMVISLIALIANVTCLFLISKHRGGGIHMKASWIFSTNDVIANLGVISAGAMVYFFKSPIPDLIVGFIISIVVVRGAWVILKISKVPT
ncbi:MAG: cation transporter [Bdellovibrionales bacterium]|nr:cation transporter [Bdellovibrionales bacterium]